MSTPPVIVAGAGPAGCATALSLRRRGVPVLVLDRACFPRDKACGDVLLPDAQAALAQLGLDVDALKRSACACTGLRYVPASGPEIAGAFRDALGHPKPWLMIKRSVLDAWLVENARAAGAEVREGWTVAGAAIAPHGGNAVTVHARAPHGARALATRVIVGADGAASAVARSLGVRRPAPEHLYVACRTYVRGLPVSEPYAQVFATEDTLPGCAWMVPIGADEWNVGVGVVKRAYDRLDRGLAGLFEEVRERVPALAQALHGTRPHGFKSWILPGASERRPLVGDARLLVGDAGAMVDPFTGHGIQHALIAGRIAGEVLADALRRGELGAPALRGYESECRRLFLEDTDAGYRLQRIHARRRLMHLIVGVCRAQPALRAAFVSLVGHSDPRREVLSLGRLTSGILRSGRAR